MDISARLKEFRKKNGLTQQQVADMLNIDRSTYSYYETGKINLSINALITLCEFYGISLDSFITGNDSAVMGKAASPDFGYAEQLTDDEKRLLSSYRKLDSITKEEYLISIVGIARDGE